jgi:predicted RNA-binding Zn-ribbon protein involved in translation (DUF1610 family)
VNLRGRIGRLEQRGAGGLRAGHRCAVCGVAPADPVVYSCEPVRVIGEDRGESRGGPETCPGCGRVLVYRCEPPRDLAALRLHPS